MAKKILVMGLPGSGKSTLSNKLKQKLSSAEHFEADRVRAEYDDWDFSEEGRLRQAIRMEGLGDKSDAQWAILDFICPKKEYRKLVDADIIVWMDTITKGRYDDTNEMFKKPNNNIEHIDYHFTKLDSDDQSDRIVDNLELFDTYHWKKSNG